jgi:hypothetical protein
MGDPSVLIRPGICRNHLYEVPTMVVALPSVRGSGDSRPSLGVDGHPDNAVGRPRRVTMRLCVT